MKQNPETKLRQLWTAQGVTKERQDAMIADTIAKAQPGAMVGPFRIELTPAGKQTVIPGAERATDATIAQRRADAPLKPKKAQRACDAGLFSDNATQIDLVDLLQGPR